MAQQHPDEIDITIATMRFEGRTYAEIGEAVGLAISAVWYRCRSGKPAAVLLDRMLDDSVEAARAQIRRHTTTAVRTLLHVATDEAAPQSARVSAAKELLARGGLPEHVERTVDARVSPLDALAQASRHGVSPAMLIEALEEGDEHDDGGGEEEGA
jgi:hypothetical protein